MGHNEGDATEGSQMTVQLLSVLGSSESIKPICQASIRHLLSGTISCFEASVAGAIW